MKNLKENVHGACADMRSVVGKNYLNFPSDEVIYSTAEKFRYEHDIVGGGSGVAAQPIINGRFGYAC